jgi:hypothetical protein
MDTYIIYRHLKVVTASSHEGKKRLATYVASWVLNVLYGIVFIDFSHSDISKSRISDHLKESANLAGNLI